VPFAGSGHARRGPGALDGAVRPMTEADVDSAWVGFVAVRWTEEDATPVGEVEIIAVAPSHQRAASRAGCSTARSPRSPSEASRSPSSARVATPGTRRPALCTSGTGSAASPLVRYYRPL
jgi:hypothetical protein